MSRNVLNISALLFAGIALTGCAAPHMQHPEPYTSTRLPSVLLRSSHMAATAQKSVAEVIFVQSHPPVVSIAPSHFRAVDDRFSFHWIGSLNAVTLNLSAAMGWSLDMTNHQPRVYPSVYIDQHNVTATRMIHVINQQAMPTAMLRLDSASRAIVLTVPTKQQVAAWEQRKKACQTKIKVVHPLVLPAKKATLGFLKVPADPAPKST
ncbi:DotD/TraH family lipoprotein [Acidithiobacillus sp. MC6.1]|nr:DotD/TraH family lipoprotein [Acidithiobacillus sp. MC6.1]